MHCHLNVRVRSLRCCETAAAGIWSSVVQRLPSELLKFSLNAVQDTLPHNSNLAKWRNTKHLSSSCKLCQQKQILHHVLNNCPKALTLCRYNEQPDSVLELLVTFFESALPEGFKITADLPRFKLYIFPPHIAQTDDRPDILIWSDDVCEIRVIELNYLFRDKL